MPALHPAGATNLTIENHPDGGVLVLRLPLHRSVIVNIDSIAHLETLSHGEFDVVMKDGARRRISRTYRAGLERQLGQALSWKNRGFNGAATPFTSAWRDALFSRRHLESINALFARPIAYVS